MLECGGAHIIGDVELLDVLCRLNKTFGSVNIAHLGGPNDQKQNLIGQELHRRCHRQIL
jgi:hypothetical protein